MLEISLRYVLGKEHDRHRGRDSQGTQQKDAAQFKTLPDRNVQTPHHWQWQEKNQNIED